MQPTVAVCQLALEDLAVDTNLATVRERVNDLGDDVDLAVFPEHTLTGFVADERLEAVALPRDGAPIRELQSLAGQREIALVVGFVETTASDCYNATAYIGPAGDLTVYRKRHLWDRENDVLTAGNELVTVETPIGNAGLLTCYDLNFVDDSAALARADVTALLVAGAWPGAYSDNWRLLLRARALDGVRWAIGANRTGQRDIPDSKPVTYAGHSLVARPDGGIHHALGRQDRTLVTDIDPSVLDHQRDLIGVFSE
ncbi:carbon-nitrogen hydrolase family protein [Natronorubrum aibiense]|uniref:Carbon-nitrogen hydrolase family protein n=1 Tax=Natronorubrum aibiense TaxID=348826 RepID=A0A5P9P9A6_9EURY|nr:carbon-nitrogen hydrolase family protein [Natronorubrum aibiense]QFU84706.1 carbon-nitrogen hydrolase family protein [Natronorubrum aibiense]